MTPNIPQWLKEEIFKRHSHADLLFPNVEKLEGDLMLIYPSKEK